MAELHPHLAPALRQVPADAALHLLTRHSVREAAAGRFADYSLALTLEGVRLAEGWGRRLERPLDAFFSSPVQRCVDTALAMRRGAGSEKTPVEITDLLVEPGCYVQDIERAGPAFFRLGALGFINRHLSEGQAGVLTPWQGRRLIAAHLRATAPAPGHLTVHVTHDTILAAFVAGLHSHERIGEEDWPWMMEGVWVWLADDRLHWIWRGQAGALPLPRVFASDAMT